MSTQAASNAAPIALRASGPNEALSMSSRARMAAPKLQPASCYSATVGRGLGQVIKARALQCRLALLQYHQSARNPEPPCTGIDCRRRSNAVWAARGTRVRNFRAPDIAHPMSGALNLFRATVKGYSDQGAVSYQRRRIPAWRCEA